MVEMKLTLIHVYNTARLAPPNIRPHTRVSISPTNMQSSNSMVTSMQIGVCVQIFSRYSSVARYLTLNATCRVLAIPRNSAEDITRTIQLGAEMEDPTLQMCIT